MFSLAVLICLFSLVKEYALVDPLIGYSEMEDLDTEQLEGQWWEYQNFNTFNPIEPNGYDCLVANFYTKGDKITIMEDFIRCVPGTNNKDHTRRVWALTRNGDSKARKNGNFLGQTTTENGIVQVIYSVVGTDYNNWLLVGIHSEYINFRGAYFMTRSRNFSKSQAAVIEKSLREVLSKIKNTTLRKKSYPPKQNAECTRVAFPKEVPM